MERIPLKRIGVYGGGFDPVHIAHLILAQTALESLSLDRVIFIPSGGVAHYKNESNVASGEDRLEMLRLAAESNPRFEICSYEIEQGKFCYTIDTLRYLRDEVFPDAEINLLTGEDWKNRLKTWKDGDKLLQEFCVAIFSRPGFQKQNDGQSSAEAERICHVDMPLIDISSSDIRERRRKGLSIEYMLPRAVYRYIEEKGLYL
ncbi:MAG: nicotinate-nucleotide adenylyltransferase [Candidatus Omnitrophota bacterium]